MKAKISLITLGVLDINKSKEFYSKLLKKEPSNYKEGDQMVMYEMDGTWLGLFPKAELAKDVTVSGEGQGFPGFTIAHNVKSESEVDNTYNHAITCGAKPIKIPQKVSWGGYSCYFADPDGYYWEIAFNPFTDLS